MDKNNFGKDKGTKDGFHMSCKMCQRKYNEEYYNKNREHIIQTSRQYQLNNVEQTAKNKARWRQENADIQHERDRIWKAENKEYWDNYHITWHMLNPERQKIYSKNHRNHDITKSEWEKELKVFNYQCAYCGITEEENKDIYNEKLHKDHADHEGYNDIRNAIPACTWCNSHKWQYDMEEWFRQQEFFSEERLEYIKWWLNEGYKDYIEEKPPYKIIKERNKGLNTYHFNLWSVDEKRNIIKIIATGNKRKDLNKYIEEYF